MEVNHRESLFRGSVQNEARIEKKITALGIPKMRHPLFPLDQVTASQFERDLFPINSCSCRRTFAESVGCLMRFDIPYGGTLAQRCKPIPHLEIWLCLLLRNFNLS